MNFWNILIIVLIVILLILIIYYLVVSKKSDKKKSEKENDKNVYNLKYYNMDSTPTPTATPVPIPDLLKQDLDKFLPEFTNKFKYVIGKNFSNALTINKDSLKFFFNTFCNITKGSLGTIIDNIQTYIFSDNYTNTPDISISGFKNIDLINFIIDPNNNNIEYICDSKTGKNYIKLHLIMSTYDKTTAKCLQITMLQQKYIYVKLIIDKQDYDIAIDLPVVLQIEVLQNSSTKKMCINLNNYIFDKRNFTFKEVLPFYGIFSLYFMKYKAWLIPNDILKVLIPKFFKGEKFLEVLYNVIQGKISENGKFEFLYKFSEKITSEETLYILSTMSALFLDFVIKSVNTVSQNLDTFFTNPIIQEDLDIYTLMENGIGPPVPPTETSIFNCGDNVFLARNRIFCFLITGGNDIINQGVKSIKIWYDIGKSISGSTPVGVFLAGGMLLNNGFTFLCANLLQYGVFSILIFIYLMFALNVFLSNNTDPIDCTRLIIGQQISIPMTNGEIQEYIIKNGDDCVKICTQFNITHDELVNANKNISNIFYTDYECNYCTYNTQCPSTVNPPAINQPCCECPPLDSENYPEIKNLKNLKIDQDNICIPNCNVKYCGDDDGCGGYCYIKYINESYDPLVTWNVAIYDNISNATVKKASYILDTNTINNEVKTLISQDKNNVNFIYDKDSESIFISSGNDIINTNSVFYYDFTLNVYKNFNLNLPTVSTPITIIYPSNCNDECYTFQSDKNNCGTCGNICANCEQCCGGKCVDFNTNKDNCGKCGNACDNNSYCCDGICKKNRGSDCKCLPGWSGDDCNISTPQCNNNGITDTNGKCICNIPWTGDSCNTCPSQYKDCNTKECADCYSGPSCEYSRVNCNSHGCPVYDFDKKEFSCKCDNKYVGVFCDEQEL